MRIGVLFANGLVLGTIGWLASVGGTEERASALVPKHALATDTATREFQGLETTAALTPTAGAVAALAGAYLDRGQPGLATAVIDKAPRSVQLRPEIAQLQARALFHRGHIRDALAMARGASEACSDDGSCAPWIVAKTTRQVAFFEQMVAAGIEDAEANPDARLGVWKTIFPITGHPASLRASSKCPLLLDLLRRRTSIPIAR